MTQIPNDIIDHLAGIHPDDPISRIRQLRTTAREQAQQSFMDLFGTAAAAHSQFTRQERLLVAVFVAKLHQQDNIAVFYGDLLDGVAVDELQIVLREAESSLTQGPYGSYPKGPLTIEDQGGIIYTPDSGIIHRLGEHLAAALRHTHLLVFHLRDANPQALQQLINAGWTTADMVTLSQLVSFLTYQIRVVTGLQVLLHASGNESARQEVNV